VSAARVPSGALATCGRTGLELARRLRPDLILLDLHLDDLNGEKLLLQLQADPITRAIPVVVVSADAMVETVERLQAAGAARFLTKPFALGELLTVVHAIPAAVARDVTRIEAAEGSAHGSRQLAPAGSRSVDGAQVLDASAA